MASKKATTKTTRTKKTSSGSKKGKIVNKIDLIPEIMKRDGSIVAFDPDKVVNVIWKAMQATGEGSEEEAQMVANNVVADIFRIKKRYSRFMPTVEGVSDTVEKELMRADYLDTAKAYILYRQERSKVREKKKFVSDEFKEKVWESKKYFTNPLAELVYYRTYSRWSDEKGRRETWGETVDRFMDFMDENLGKKLSKKDYKDVKEGILNMDAMPSMRLVWSSGKAARKTNVTAYNCSFIAPTEPRDFAEIMYLSMCGAGVGYSVEPEFVEQLPQIKRQTGKKLDTYVVKDSKEGWADAFTFGLETWFSGKDVEFDFSELRPAGARLMTMGGRSSGPQPIINLVEFAREKILGRQGKRLRTIDVHDIICKIGEIVQQGGVRRSAMISISALDDVLMRDAKKGEFYLKEPQRSMANNSAVYEKQPTNKELLDEWQALIKSNAGERGIYNRGGLEESMPKRRVDFLKKKYGDDAGRWPVGPNPCGEINLQSKQFCNLTSITIRPGDTVKDLKRKVRLATILGTYQASLTHFPYLSEEWKKNSEEEALLGVSMTGYYDNPVAQDDKVLKELRDMAVRTNKTYAKKFGINPSMAITAIKPEGNSSQLRGTSSGMHPRYAPYYIRRIRISRTDPLSQFLIDQKVPHAPEVGQTMENAHTIVFEFPIESPKEAILKEDVSALDLLKEWRRIKVNYTEHNPSVTIYVGEDEWIPVVNFVQDNWDIVGGLSFLPRDNHVYKLAPYEPISKQEYEKKIKEMPDIDFSELMAYEATDQTTGAKELACAAGVCDVDDALAIDANEANK